MGALSFFRHSRESGSPAGRRARHRKVDSRVRGDGGGKLRPILRFLHRTLGLFAAFYVLMAAATGAVLMFKKELLGLAHPELGPMPADPVARAQALAERLEAGSFQSIMLPTEALPAFIVYRPEHRTELFDPATLQPLEGQWLRLAMDWTFDLHHYLLAGETGKIVSGAFGLAIVGLIAIGLYLWWPWRRGWRLSHARPKRPSHAARLAGHTSLAVLMAPVLFVTALTGASVIFHEQARGALVALFGERDPAVPPPSGEGTLSGLSRAAFPDAEPRLLVPAAEPGGAWTLRVRQPEEIHPNGRSTLSWDPATGRATAATSEPESGAGSRIYNLLYPLHIGTIGGLPLRLFYLASSVLAFLAAWWGIRAWFSRRRRRAG